MVWAKRNRNCPTERGPALARRRDLLVSRVEADRVEFEIKKMDSRKENYQNESYPRHIPTQRIQSSDVALQECGMHFCVPRMNLYASLPGADEQ